MEDECSYGTALPNKLTNTKGENWFPSTVTKEKQDGGQTPLVISVTFSRAKEIKWWNPVSGFIIQQGKAGLT